MQRRQDLIDELATLILILKTLETRSLQRLRRLIFRNRRAPQFLFPPDRLYFEVIVDLLSKGSNDG